VEAKSGEILLIELQFTQQVDFLQRMLYGTSKAISERMYSSDEYVKVKKIYSINIVYFDLGQGSDYVYHGKTHFIGLHTNDELHLSETQRETLGKETAADIYPEYYILKINSFNDVAKDTLDEWIYFFKHNVIRDEFKAKGIMGMARKALERDKLTQEEQKDYDYLMHIRSDNRSYFASARDEGRVEGRKEGREERKKLAEALEKEREEHEKERADLLAEIARLKQSEK
jgi:predicted transposase/invertase (TIGR01784 family)